MAQTTKNVVLIGSTGNGKSSVGNMILGEPAFSTKASANSVTTECQRKEKIIKKKKIAVIDTPDFFDTENEEKMKSEIIKALIECSEGIHAFVIVLKVGRFTTNERKMVQQLLNTLTEEHVLKHTVILFTFGEQLEGKTTEEFMKDCSQLQELVDKCGGRCHVIDNKYWNKRKRGNKSNKVQVKNLLETIDKIVEENGRFTSEVLLEVEKHIQEEVKNITEENVPPEEQREKAKKIVHCNYLRQFAGAATEAVLGALIGISMFPSLCFNAHFEVSHEKRVMEMPNFEKKSLNSQKKCLRSLEVVFDLCEKGLMWIMGDGNAFCE
uniref:Zgc:195075 n=1 Tax=Sinocyclocheilus anshuiensis TaxID=1608454 RepID=A0A671L4F9_9TELE